MVIQQLRIVIMHTSHSTRFYEVKNLESDILIGMNLLSKAKIQLNFEDNTLLTNEKKRNFTPLTKSS